MATSRCLPTSAIVQQNSQSCAILKTVHYTVFMSGGKVINSMLSKQSVKDISILFKVK